jgi:hypothetical protein
MASPVIYYSIHTVELLITLILFVDSCASFAMALKWINYASNYTSLVVSPSLDAKQLDKPSTPTVRFVRFYI